MSAHTKGPWIAATHGLSVHGVTPEGLTGPAVCMLMTKSGALDNHEASARLIAAAPAMVKALETAYLALLQHPLDLWRVQNQPLLCTLRDTLAECTGQSGEDVQNEYEARAAIKAAKGEA